MQSYRTNVTQNIGMTATLPRNMFKGAKNRDTIIVCLYDTEKKDSTASVEEILPKAIEQACYIWTQKFNEKFRPDAMLSSTEGIEVRPPLQILVVGVGKELTTPQLGEILKKNCHQPHLPLMKKDIRSMKNVLELLQRHNCVAIDPRNRDECISGVGKALQKLYETKISIGMDGSCRLDSEHASPIGRSDAGCCVVS